MAQGAQQTEEPGWSLKRILAVHKGIRSDLALLQRAVDAITKEGQDVETAMSAIGELSFIGPGWTFRTYCDFFCKVVHEHHTTEDALVFPPLLGLPGSQTEEFRAVIKRLETEHAAISGYVAEVERTLQALPGDEAAKDAAARAMDQLSEHLRAHLSFEEEELAPALNELSRAVPEDQVPPTPPAPAHWDVSF